MMPEAKLHVYNYEASQDEKTLLLEAPDPLLTFRDSTNLQAEYNIKWQRNDSAGETESGLRFYRVSADSPDFMIDLDGRVGIGTTDPATSLDIEGKLQLSSNSSSALWRIETGSDSISFKEDGTTNRLCIKDGGSVGVGVLTPVEKLEVDGGVKLGFTSSCLLYTSPSPRD